MPGANHRALLDHGLEGGRYGLATGEDDRCVELRRRTSERVPRRLGFGLEHEALSLEVLGAGQVASWHGARRSLKGGLYFG
jgi:hypothetical protein